MRHDSKNLSFQKHITISTRIWGLEQKIAKELTNDGADSSRSQKSAIKRPPRPEETKSNQSPDRNSSDGQAPNQKSNEKSPGEAEDGGIKVAVHEPMGERKKVLEVGSLDSSRRRLIDITFDPLKEIALKQKLRMQTMKPTFNNDAASIFLLFVGSYIETLPSQSF